MDNISKKENKTSNQRHLIPSTSTGGTPRFFPWSPRTAQSLLVNPNLIRTKHSYSTHQPSLMTKPNLTSKVQEISIDQTWFKTTDTVQEEVSVDSMNKVQGISKTESPVVDEDLIVPQTAERSESMINKNHNQPEYESLRYKLKTLNQSSNVDVEKKVTVSVADEDLHKIEQLILSKEKLHEFSKSDDKYSEEREARTGQILNDHNKTCYAQCVSKPDIINNRQKHYDYLRSNSFDHASVCSSCSAASTVPSRSRCSSGDGCSSVECEGVYHATCYIPGQSYSHEAVQSLQLKSTSVRNGERNLNLSSELLNQNCSCDDKSLPTSTRSKTGRGLMFQAHAGLETDLTGSLVENRCTCIRNTCKLMFYIIKLQISKYGELKFLIEAQQKSLSLQGQSINRLMHCVLLLSVKVHQQTSALDCLTAALRRQEVERHSQRRRQTIVFTVVIGLVFIYVLHMKSVQGKLTTFFRMFGVTRQLESLYRTRRKISEIWRDIPPLLTNFWRIFIFKGRTE